MIVYDIEIEKAILGKGETPQEGIEYCKGWHDHVGMGISVVTAYDFFEDRYYVFLQDNLHELEALCSGRTVIGFNSSRFDDKVCMASGVTVETTYDLRFEILAALNLDQYARGLNLDRIAKANLPAGKTGHGAQAPVDWQKGRYGHVINYCLEDTRITKRLIKRIIDTGGLNDPRTGLPFSIAPPETQRT